MDEALTGRVKAEVPQAIEDLRRLGAAAAERRRLAVAQLAALAAAPADHPA